MFSEQFILKGDILNSNFYWLKTRKTPVSGMEDSLDLFLSYFPILFFAIGFIGNVLVIRIVHKTRQMHTPTSLTNSRGSRVAGPMSRVAGPMSRSRVQCRGRGSNVAVAGPKSRSRVQCRGRGKWFENDWYWKQYEGKKSVLCTILYGSQFTGYGC